MKSKKYVLAIDLGGTKILAAIVDSQGTIIKQHKAKTQLAGGWPILKKQLLSIFNELSDSNYPISAIGIGSAGPLNALEGTLIDPTNFGWSKKIVYLKKDLEKLLKLPVAFDNDAASAVLGEHWLGKTSGNSICITLGTGLGVGTLVQGQIVRGRDGLHPETGHFVLRPGDKTAKCECGVVGCAEGFLSGVNFTKWVNKNLKTKFKNGAEVELAAKSGNKKVLYYFDQYAELMAQFISSLIVTYYPKEIVLTGSFAAAHPLFLNKTKKILKKSFKRQQQAHPIIPDVRISKLKNNNGLIGAAYLAFKMDVAI